MHEKKDLKEALIKEDEKEMYRCEEIDNRDLEYY